MNTTQLRKTVVRAIVAVGVTLGLLFAGSAPFDFNDGPGRATVAAQK
ncbi:MAG: hypothetical protein H7Z42_18175 [Roseiflexaceae bacterium]|nr:hypothetical protein [Roseiflexaceae bacterium]